MIIFAFAVFAYLLLDYFFDLPPEELQFVEEKVELKVISYRLVVNCEYTFFNPTSQAHTYTLFFPIMNDFDSQSVRLTVISDNRHKPVKFKIKKSGILHKLPAPAKSRAQLKISYEQPLKEKRVQYITLTTRFWKKPLANAEFIVYLPAKDKLLRSTYPLELKHIDSEMQVYYSKQMNFYPKENLEIIWE
ncbi:MAG: DUF4424 family protein [Candidatus Sumerlaeia bacterium]|nr:DUF4424 family protein [Candidatus Sumerlaeia bacterium]